jgi:hypothetical protein
MRVATRVCMRVPSVTLSETLFREHTYREFLQGRR